MSLPITSEPEPRTGLDPTLVPAACWEGLTYLEQNLLLAAVAEKPLWMPCASVADERDTSPAESLRTAASRLVDLGLVWFYRVVDGYPDLTAAEVAGLCGDSIHWHATDADCQQVGLYLTDCGEEIFPLYSNAGDRRFRG
jgi:hypothetical protein